jgi:hypothetical protein
MQPADWVVLIALLVTAVVLVPMFMEQGRRTELLAQHEREDVPGGKPMFQFRVRTKLPLCVSREVTVDGAFGGPWRTLDGRRLRGYKFRMQVDMYAGDLLYRRALRDIVNRARAC